MTYLTGDDLTVELKKVMAGKRPRMCVAFLGKGWAEILFKGSAPKNLKVICDLNMKGTTQ